MIGASPPEEGSTSPRACAASVSGERVRCSTGPSLLVLTSVLGGVGRVVRHHRSCGRGSSGTRRHREAGNAPLGEPVDQSPGREPARPEHLQRLGGQHAVGPPAVRHDLGLPGKLGQPLGELSQRQGDRPRDVPRPVLLGWPHVHHNDLLAADALHELLAAHRLEPIPGLDVIPDDPLHLGQPPRSQVAKGHQEPAHLVAGQAVEDLGSFLASLHQAGGTERLQVGRSIGEPHRRGVGHALDGAFALAQQVQDLQPLGGGHRLADPGELVVEPVLDLAPGRLRHSSNSSNNLLRSIEPRSVKKGGRPAVDIETIVDKGLGNASYLVDLGDGSGLVVDPGRDPRPYLQAAAQRGLRDEEEVELGGLTARALATPGHTPEHLAYLLLDGGDPVAVFTGGSLLRGSVARTDLLGSDRAESLARDLFGSIRNKLFTLPEGVVTFPTHGAGATFCAVAPTIGEGASSTEGTSTTIGVARRTNGLLQAPSGDEFVRSLLPTFSTYPRYFLTLRDVNRRGPPMYGDARPTLPLLGVDEIDRLLAEGAALVDVRPIEEFAAGHVPGALSNALRPAFATWLGWLVEPNRSLVFVAGDGQDRAELIRQCLAIGFDRLTGELEGGMRAWRDAGLPEATIELLPPEEADRATFLDVRQQCEFDSAHIPGARHVELGSLEAEAVTLPTGPLTVHCGHGERAMTGASILERAGRRDLAVLLGGPGDWSAACGVPLEHGGG